MAGGDWFSQYIQSLRQPQVAPTPNMSTGAPNNILNAMGDYPGYVPPASANEPGTTNLAGDSTGHFGPTGFLQQLFNQLLHNSGPVNPAPNPADILKQATLQASQQYDPQISAIQRQMGQTKVRAGKNKAELGKLYGGAANAYNSDISSAKKTNAQAVADEKQRQKDLQAGLKSDYSASINDQLKQLQNLGIQSAAPAATENQNSDLNYLSKLNDTLGNAAMSNINEQNTGDLQYYNEGKGIARQEGANAQSDLMTQLSDYLNQEGGNIATLQGQKQAAINTLQQQLTQQAAKSQQTEQQQQWDNLFKLAGLYNTISKAGQTPQATHGLNAASQFLAGATTPQKAQDTMSALDMLLGQGFATGQKDANGHPMYSTSPEQSASLGVNYANKNGWGSQDALNLMQAILAYYGKLGG